VPLVVLDEFFEEISIGIYGASIDEHILVGTTSLGYI
jgi:hypothetical protein